MYKSRIEKWGLRKSLGVQDIPELIQQFQQGKLQSSTSAVVIRGRKVALQKVDRYLKRNPTVGLAHQHTAPGNEQRIISAPRLLPLPDDLRWPDEVLRLLGQFVAGSCEGSWCPDGKIPVFFASPEALNWLNDANSAIELIQTNQFKQAFAALNVAFDQLTGLLRDPDPTLLVYVYSLLLELPENISQRMIAYLAEMATILLPANHPMTYIWSRFSLVSRQYLSKHAWTILGSYFELLGQSFSHPVLSFLKFSRVFYTMVGNAEYFSRETAISKIWDILRALEVWGGSKDDLLHTKLTLSYTLINDGKHAAAEALIEQAGRDIHREDSLTLHQSYYSRSYELNKARGNHREAIDAGRRYLLASMKQYGAITPGIMAYCYSLQSYCAEVGNVEEANRLLEVAESRLELKRYFRESGMIDEKDYT
jgi:tetratricopeptide (TPR) repeat protein